MATNGKIITYTGFYTPHAPVVYDGSVTNPITGEVTFPPSMTKQSEAAACDINNIIRDYRVTGQIQHINRFAQQGMYADLGSALDFQESLHVVKQAQDAFASLPSAIRAEFDNDPARFLAYVADPANKERLYDWGLAQRPETAPPAANEPGNPGSPTPPPAPPQGS